MTGISPPDEDSLLSDGADTYEKHFEPTHWSHIHYPKSDLPSLETYNLANKGLH